MSVSRHNKMGYFSTSSLTNTKATSPKGTWDNFKNQAEKWILRILYTIAAIVVGFIALKLALRAYRSAARTKLQAEIGELRAEIQVAKEFGGAQGYAPPLSPSYGLPTR